MDFFEAIQALKEGKKLRKKTWVGDSWIKLISKENKFIDESGLYNNFFEISDEWEIYEEKKPFVIEKTKTIGGFDLINFFDCRGQKCFLQESSFKNDLWFGCSEGRFQLNQEMVKALLPYLCRFAEIGKLEK